MRFLVHEQPYEQLLAAGRYEYRRDDTPTGAYEHWRLTAAVDGYRLLRVDLDARDAASGDSYLYHLIADSAGRPERLTFRFLGGSGQRVAGNVFFAADGVTLARERDGLRSEQTLTSVSGATPFWFPATAGLGFLVQNGAMGSLHTALLLNKAQEFTLTTTPLLLHAAAPVMLAVLGQPRLATPLTLSWGDQQRRLWLDGTNWPLQMDRAGLVAVADRYRRITGPTGSG